MWVKIEIIVTCEGQDIIRRSAGLQRTKCVKMYRNIQYRIFVIAPSSGIDPLNSHLNMTYSKLLISLQKLSK